MASKSRRQRRNHTEHASREMAAQRTHPSLRTRQASKTSAEASHYRVMLSEPAAQRPCQSFRTLRVGSMSTGELHERLCAPLRVPARVSRAKGEGRWTFTAERVQRRGRSAADCLAEEGEVEFEPGANPARGVGDDEAAALAVGELAGEVQAKADPAGPGGRAGVQLGESLEDALPVGWWDTRAGVLDDEDHLAAVASARQPHRFVVGRVLAGVVEQVADDLLDRVGTDKNRQGAVGLHGDAG